MEEERKWDKKEIPRKKGLRLRYQCQSSALQFSVRKKGDPEIP